MAQVGRISGPLLQENLERNGIDLAFETDLIYLDVNSGRIGINTNSPTNELQNPSTTRTTNLIVDTQADINNIINIQGSTIQPFPGSLILDSNTTITANRVKTDNLLFDDNTVSSYTPNANIEIRPNGTGIVDIPTSVDVDGNIHASGNITFDGSIVYGDNLNQDTITINAEINSDVLPVTTGTYDLGTSDKRWSEIFSPQVNGVSAESFAASINNVDIETRQGKIWYVAINGDNSNVGDHQHGPYRTIDHAVTQASAGDTIYVYPGVYEESCPIEIPAGVTLHGHDQRNTIIEPASSQSTTDIFLLNGETALTNFTIRNFYYDDLNDIGYAFRFAPGGKVTSRSPYIQNITVRTTGSTVTASDPLGFNSSDAGKGILVDGAVLASDTREASMLFHAITLITPGVDAVTMTNGVRVEWLKSFTYFANRGIYAANGTGRTDDNSVVRFGAEMRSIGSANIYGNQGVVADGADVLIYLVMHNFSYIGTGLDSSNDSTLVIQENETIETNDAKIHYQSQSQSGDFRVGDNFLIDFEKGNQSINVSDIPVVGVDTITITTGTDVTYLDLDYVQTGNIRLTNNSLASISGELNIVSATGETNLQSNATVDKNLDVSGNVTIGGALLEFGNNQSIDIITFTAGIDTDLDPKTTDIYDIGSTSKRWNDVWLETSLTDDITITNNVIETTQSNSNLELRTNGTGIINFTNSTNINQTLTVGASATLQGLLTASGQLNVQNLTNVTGAISASDMTIAGQLSVDGGIQFENILIDDNFIETTISNSSLELRANGTGNVSTISPVQVNNNLTTNFNTQSLNIQATSTASAEVLSITDITIEDNYINSTSNLILSALGNITATQNNVTIENDLTIGIDTFLNPTNIIGTITQVGNTTQFGNTSITGNVDLDGDLYTDRESQFEEINISGNVISTTDIDLDLRANGSGTVTTLNPVVTNGLVDVSLDVDALNVSITTSTSAEVLSITDITIEDNYINSTSNLMLSSQTGNVIIPSNNVTVENNLDVLQTTTLSTTDITGLLTHTGNKLQTGNTSITGNVDLDGDLYIDRESQFEEINISGNVISTTDIDLDLRASGTGNILIPNNNVLLGQTLTVTNNLLVNDATSSSSYSSPIFSTAQATISNNEIFATAGNLILRANGAGDIEFDTSTEIDNNLTVQTATQFSDTVVNGNLDITGNRNVTGDYSSTGNLSLTGQITSTGIVFENIEFNDNYITTSTSNSDLELRADGNGLVRIQENLIVENNLTINELNTSSTVSQTQIESSIFTNNTLQIDTNNVSVLTLDTDLVLSADGTGSVITNGLDVTQDLNVNTLSTLTDTNIAGTLDQTGNYDLTGNMTVNGDVTVSGILTADRQVQIEDVFIDDNIITTASDNLDLILNASGTGNILVPENNVRFSQNLTVSGLTSTTDITVSAGNNISSFLYEASEVEIRQNRISNTVTNNDLVLSSASQFNTSSNVVVENSIVQTTVTNLLQTDITGTLTHLGDRNQTGSIDITGNVSVDTTIDVTSTANIADVEISGNKIQTTALNSNLEIRTLDPASKVTVTFSDVQIDNDLTVLGNINSTGISNILILSSENLLTSKLEFFDNNITTFELNNDIVLTANGTGSVLFDSNDVEISNNVTTGTAALLNLNINGNVTHTGNKTQTGDYTQLGNTDVSANLDADSIFLPTIDIQSNIIQTSLSNSDLELRALRDVIIDDSLSVAQDLDANNLSSVTINASVINSATFTTSDVNITNNSITTLSSNLELSSTDITTDVVFDSSTVIDNNLTVNSNTTLQDTNVNNTITQVGDRNVSSITIEGDLNVTGGLTTSVQFEEVNINDNVITTTRSNADLDLRASGTGEVLFNPNSRIAQNLYLNGVSNIEELTVSSTTSVEKVQTQDIEIYDNRIQTTESNSNLELRANGTGNIDLENTSINLNTISSNSEQSININLDSNVLLSADSVKLPAGDDIDKTINNAGDLRFNTQSGLFEGFSTDRISFSGVYSSNRQTSVAATPTSNQLTFSVNGLQVATVSETNFQLNGVVLPEIDIKGSVLTTTVTNNNLTIDTGTSSLNVNDLEFLDNSIINNANTPLVLQNQGSGIVELHAPGIKIPSGTTAEQTSVEAGDTRWNTESQILETFDGNTYISSAGTANNITPDEFDDLLLEYTLIFG